MNPTIALLGLGQMGLSTLDILLDRLPDARFLALDRDERAVATAVARRPDRITGRPADITSTDLDLTGAEIVVNLAGPFFTGSDQAARAAIAAGAAYVDISDDLEGARRVLDLDATAAAAGVPVVTGAGFSPGITNWMACRLLAEHPDADGVQVAWVVHESDPGGLAPLRHMLHLAVSPCPVLRDGQWHDSPGFVPSTAQDFTFPEPIGPVETYDTAHPEPVTLARAYPHLTYASCKGALRPEWANSAFSMLGRIGFGYDDNDVEVVGTTVDPTEVLWRLMWKRRNRRPDRGGRTSYTAAQVQALRGGEIVGGLDIFDDEVMARATGLGAAVAVAVLAEHGAPPGAHGPEVLPWERALGMLAGLTEHTRAFPVGIRPLELAPAG